MNTMTREAGMADATDETAAAAAADTNGDGTEPERKSLDQLAAEDPDVDNEPEQFTLFGTASKLNGKVGGPRITAGAVKFKAKREPLPGQFEMGETVRGTFHGTVVDIGFVSKKNSDGSIEVTRVHTVALERISQAEDVPEEFATLDGRGKDPERDAETERLRARVTELEGLLEA